MYSDYTHPSTRPPQPPLFLVLARLMQSCHRVQCRRRRGRCCSRGNLVFEPSIPTPSGPYPRFPSPRLYCAPGTPTVTSAPFPPHSRPIPVAFQRVSVSFPSGCRRVPVMFPGIGNRRDREKIPRDCAQPLPSTPACIRPPPIRFLLLCLYTTFQKTLFPFLGLLRTLFCTYSARFLPRIAFDRSRWVGSPGG